MASGGSDSSGGSEYYSPGSSDYVRSNDGNTTTVDRYGGGFLTPTHETLEVDNSTGSQTTTTSSGF